MTVFATKRGPCRRYTVVAGKKTTFTIHARIPCLEHRSAWAHLHALAMVIDIYTNEYGMLEWDVLKRSVRFLQRTVLPYLKTIAITIQFDRISACIELMAEHGGPRFCADLEEAISRVEQRTITIASDQGIRSARKSLWAPRAERLFPAMKARDSLIITAPWST